MYEPEDSWAEFDAKIAQFMKWVCIALLIGLLVALAAM